MSRISDLAWAKETGGRLSRLEVAGLVRDVLLLMAKRRFARRAPPPLPGTLDIAAAVRLPGSGLVADALAECREICHPAIALHCLRTFAFASLLGQASGLAYDREMLAVAALLHDIDLGQTEQRSRTKYLCFACASAVGAAQFAVDRGRDPAWARRVGDAIARHLDPIVRVTDGAEAHLLHAGAGIDVIGAGMGQIPKAARAWVLAAHPRDGFKREISEAMRREADLGGRTRASCLVALGFIRRIHDAPLP